jgi:hypothetical protein
MRKCGVGNDGMTMTTPLSLYFFVFIKRAYTRLRATKIEHNNNDDDDDDCSPIFENESFVN